MLNGSDDEEKYYNKKTIELWMRNSDNELIKEVKEEKKEKEDTIITYLLSLLNLKCLFIDKSG